MFKKKLVCMMLSLSFLSSFMIKNASYASDSSELADSYESESTKFPVLSDDEFEALMEEVRAEAKANITPELIQEVEDIQEELNNCEELQEILSPRYVASIDSMSLEAALAEHDGLNIIDVGMIGGMYATLARNKAKKLYTDLGNNIEMKSDAFRHSYWSFLSTTKYNYNAAKITGVNHE